MGSFSPVPMIVMGHAATRLSGRAHTVGADGLTDSQRSARSDRRFEFWFFSILLGMPLSFIGWMVYDLVVTQETVYQVQATVYAYDLRTIGSKSSKRHDIVHVSAVAPNGGRSVHSTGLHTSNCPLVDMHTPVTLEVTRGIHKWTGEERRWSARLLTQPCRLK